MLSIVAGCSSWGLVQRLRTKFTTSQTFLILNALGIVATIFFTTDLYERYLLGFFILFIIIISSLFNISITKFSVFSLILLVLISVLLQVEFMNATRAKYILAEKIKVERNISSQLYVEGTSWGKLVYAQRTKDYTGIFGKDERGISYQCFVQEYTTDSTGWFYTFLSNLDAKITSVFVVNNPQGTRKREDIPRIKKNMDKLIYTQKVFSPQKELFGKGFYVGAWCRN